jgi:hypothetical protein
MFKPGDRVRYIGDYTNKIYQVTEREAVTIQYPNRTPFLEWASNLELAPVIYNIGDIVDCRGYISRLIKPTESGWLVLSEPLQAGNRVFYVTNEEITGVAS